MRIGPCAAAIAACLAFGTAAAADFASATRLVCATVEAMDCEAGAPCFRGGPAEVGAPAFMRVDLEQKTVAGPNRTTAILHVEKNGNSTLLQGTETGFGWSMAIDTADGSMAATMVNREGAFVLFGSCMPL